MSNFKTIIFLDIDGVLRTFKSDLEWSRKLNIPVLKGTDRKFDRSAVATINEIISWTHAKIVITSSWRIGLSLNDLKKIFRDNNIYADIVGKLDVIGSRGEEIQYWLNDNDVSKYVVIDDNINDIIDFIPNDKIIKVDSNHGLSDKKWFDIILDKLV